MEIHEVEPVQGDDMVLALGVPFGQYDLGSEVIGLEVSDRSHQLSRVLLAKDHRGLVVVRLGIGNDLYVRPFPAHPLLPEGDVDARPHT